MIGHDNMDAWISVEMLKSDIIIQRFKSGFVRYVQDEMRKIHEYMVKHTLHLRQDELHEHLDRVSMPSFLKED